MSAGGRADRGDRGHALPSNTSSAAVALAAQFAKGEGIGDPGDQEDVCDDDAHAACEERQDGATADHDVCATRAEGAMNNVECESRMMRKAFATTALDHRTKAGCASLTIADTELRST